MHGANETAEHHVDGSRVENGCEEDETALDCERCELVGMVVRKYASGVPEYLNWEEDGG
jgi:hypothetical protein